jgi:hypothetical protein
MGRARAGGRARRPPGRRPGATKPFSRFPGPALDARRARKEGAAILAAAAGRLAKLISDIHDRAPLVGEAHAAMTFPSYRDRYLPAMTPRRIARAPDKAWAPVILATGAIEQHGPHLPVAVDALMGQVWLSLALARLSRPAPRATSPRRSRSERATSTRVSRGR